MLTRKRSSSSSSSSLLDCQSLQSSLKRVRLSCSPGELRLQRDLELLPRCDWGTPHTNVRTGESQWRHVSTNCTLTQQDALRICLQFSNGTSRLWLQVPRRYPHRPPVVSRLEDLWMEGIIVTERLPDISTTSDADAASSASNGRESEDTPAICTSGRVVVYNQWSPIQPLSDLLDFLLTVCGASNNSSHPRHSLVEFGSPSAAIPYDRPFMVSSPRTTTAAATTTPANIFGFVEEHKLEEEQAPRHRLQQQHRRRRPFPKLCSPQDPQCHDDDDSDDMDSVLFPPNRFDTGYGKYMDPIVAHQSMDIL